MLVRLWTPVLTLADASMPDGELNAAKILIHLRGRTRSLASSNHGLFGQRHDDTHLASALEEQSFSQSSCPDASIAPAPAKRGRLGWSNRCRKVVIYCLHHLPDSIALFFFIQPFCHLCMATVYDCASLESGACRIQPFGQISGGNDIGYFRAASDM